MQNRLVLALTVILLGSPGCLYHGNYPNGYYGPQGQPYNGYPSTPMYSPGTPMYAPGTPLMAPGGTSPTPLNGGNQPSFTTDPNNPQTYSPGSNSAPTFNTTPGTGGTGGAGGVPQPGDDSTGDSGFNRGTNRSPLTPTSSVNIPNDESTPFTQQESRLPRDFPDDATSETYVPFEKPVVQSGAGRDGDIQQVNNQIPGGRPGKTYAHDAQFNWVQGIVEYDEPSKTWVIMYDDNPKTSDPFGGELTIVGDLTGARLRSGDIVRISGNVDQTQEDGRGKPVFLATRLQKL